MEGECSGPGGAERMDAGHIIEHLLDICIARVLVAVGYEKVCQRTLRYFSCISKNYLLYIACSIHKHAAISHRTSPTVVDVVQLLLRHGLSISLPDVVSYPPLKVQRELPDHQFMESFVSEICTYVDAPSHYYDFFPRFPPSHTFKTTQIKRRIIDDKPRKARVRNEQTAEVIEGLFRMLEASETLPQRINYLL